ncbi:gamma-glutamyl carboxylase [Leptospira fluminis]|uniref:Gamma-glutamyl carboxylase n=1 Tax=Leptospira fluminis TaxID=2484979 RepID=A0A4R9GU15_9LEPT|nr:HTTM domain-containing protein [Leptospira fluminis]TGK22401.1 gamma-glutamyl carboxylase [Leptospira fluminis]
MKTKFGFLDRLRTEMTDFSPAWSLGLFRFGLGILCTSISLRYLLNDWIGKFFLEPEFHFKYFGFSWVEVLPAWLLYPLFWILSIAGLGICLGILYRLCITIYFLGFVYFNLIDSAFYLNHSYLLALLLWIMVWLPADRCLSIGHFLEAYRTGRWSNPKIRNWNLWLLRFQFACVYFFGGIAKIESDWLVRAQPLKIWLAKDTDFPVIGKFFATPIAGYTFGYTGLLFDLVVPFLLLKPKFRSWTYAFVLIFQILIWELFPVGMFPWIMIWGSALFLSAYWPLSLRNFLKRRGIFPYGEFRNLFRTVWQKLPVRFRFDSAQVLLHLLNRIEGFDRWGKRLGTPLSEPRSSRIAYLGPYVLCVYLIVQILMPLRHRLYSGNVLWTEQGSRFSWQTMLAQKNAITSFRVANVRTGEVRFVLAESYLSERQKIPMSTNPDLILQFSHYLGRMEKEKTGDEVAVYADITVSLNGRKSKPFVNPTRDLMKVKETFFSQDWILAEER